MLRKLLSPTLPWVAAAALAIALVAVSASAQFSPSDNGRGPPSEDDTSDEPDRDVVMLTLRCGSAANAWTAPADFLLTDLIVTRNPTESGVELTFSERAHSIYLEDVHRGSRGAGTNAGLRGISLQTGIEVLGGETLTLTGDTCATILISGHYRN